MWRAKRWWGVRHLRYWWHRYDLYSEARTLSDYGLGPGTPGLHDLIWLELVWRGKR